MTSASSVKVSVLPAIATPDARPPSSAGKHNSPSIVSALSQAFTTNAEPEVTAGWMYKWTNYLKGYRKRWFVLRSGVLSYYRNQASANRGATSRGTISLRESEVNITQYERDSLVIVLQVTDGSRIYFKAPNEAEKTRWFAALLRSINVPAWPKENGLKIRPSEIDVGKANAIEAEDDSPKSETEQADAAASSQDLDDKLGELRSCVESLVRHQTAFERDLVQLSGSLGNASASAISANSTSETIRALSEKGSLLRDTMTTALQACDALSSAATQHGGRCRRLIEQERSQRRRLETLVEQLAWQHRSFERQARKSFRRATRRAGNTNNDATTSSKSQPAKKTGRSWLKRASHGDALLTPKQAGDRSAKTEANLSLTHSRSTQQLAPSSAGVGANSRMVTSATHGLLLDDCRSNTVPNTSPADEVRQLELAQTDLDASVCATASMSRSISLSRSEQNLANLVCNASASTVSTRLPIFTGPAHFDDDSDDDDDDEDVEDFFDALDTSPTGSPILTETDKKTSNSTSMLSSSLLLDAHQRFQSQTTLAPARVERGGCSAPTTPTKRPNSSPSTAAFPLHFADAGADAEPDGLPEQRSPNKMVTVTVTPSDAGTGVTSKRKARRSSIKPKPAYSLNLWSILKNCVGNELSKIPMPVNFSEPISLLQRLAEDFEYSSCLDRAAMAKDPIEALALVAAFAVSPYSSTVNRTTKPFNPLLGETYELDRSDESDFGWRLIAEQVSHHPPVAALHCESAKWTCFQESTMKTKFRGKFLQIQPFGVARCDLRTRDGTVHRYSWSRVTTTVHNVIVGRLWIDHHGEMVVQNHTLGLRCQLKFAPSYSFFSRDAPRKVTGAIYDARSALRYALDGCWDERLDGYPVLPNKADPNGQPRFGERRTLWQRNPPLPDAERMYHFTRFAIELNEFEPDVAPTDSRRRPDQRLMENGEWDAANREKLRLEEKQRIARKRYESTIDQSAVDSSGDVDLDAPTSGNESYRPHRDPTYDPRWFELVHDECVGLRIFTSNGRYWTAKANKDWAGCPDIF